MNKRNKIGFINGIIASISYGLNPLFFLPLYHSGVSVLSILLYRYGGATLIYYLYIKFVKKKDLRVNTSEFLILFLLGLLFSSSSAFLFLSFKYIDSGIACTILFAYPILVAIFMRIFFKEKLSKYAILSIITGFFGIALLNYSTGYAKTSIIGFILVLSSALVYAFYIVGVKTIKQIQNIDKDKLSFYVILTGAILYLICSHFGTNFDIITTPKQLLCAIGLAILPTIVSLETINVAIKLIGATKASILGALEPLTAVFVGIIIFHEQLTINSVFGIILILTSVFLIIKK